MNVRSKTRKLILAALLFLLPVVLQAGTEEETPLCDVMANLVGLNGKEVAVRGTWGSGGHGEWLNATGCKYSLTTESHTWRNQIALVEEKSAKIDFESLAALYIQSESLKGNREDYDIIVTYIGVLETKVPLQVAHYPNGEVAPAGFGHLGIYPARLHYRAVKNVVIQKHAGLLPVNAAAQAQPASNPFACITGLEIPSYPSLAVSARLTGTARVEFVLGHRGEVANVNVEGVHDLLRSLILPGLAESRFSPACAGMKIPIQLTFVIAGEPVDATVTSVAFGYPNRFVISSRPRIPMP